MNTYTEQTNTPTLETLAELIAKAQLAQSQLNEPSRLKGEIERLRDVAVPAAPDEATVQSLLQEIRETEDKLKAAQVLQLRRAAEAKQAWKECIVAVRGIFGRLEREIAPLAQCGHLSVERALRGIASGAERWTAPIAALTEAERAQARLRQLTFESLNTGSSEGWPGMVIRFHEEARDITEAIPRIQAEAERLERAAEAVAA